ncbi:uncharacterized protein LOC125669853 [Ostrea edulis]|uniref:uncharacterized protein LOC125669853 n=1 Tax=Ostrea edulis TaxID=37623 RepID=UPI0024AEF56F|nr:uncharacterized protein LOC125669853 [Ostrea edulis]
MEGQTGEENNEQPIYQNKSNSSDVPTNTSSSNCGKDYLVIDHGEQLQRHYEINQRDLQNQVHMMRAQLSTVREVVTGMVFILAPLLVGWAGILLTRLVGYRTYEAYAVSVNIGMLAAVLLCDGPSFLEAFQRLLHHVELPVANPSATDYPEEEYSTDGDQSRVTINNTTPGVPGESGDTPVDSTENLTAAVADVQDFEYAHQFD